MRNEQVGQVRRIRPTRGSVSGVRAFRGEKPIEYESRLEYDFIIRKEFLRGVVDIECQPIQIPYRNPATGQGGIYTPDFYVLYGLGDRFWRDHPKAELVEVKPMRKWKKHWRKWLPKWKAAHRWAKANDAVFRIYDENRIRDQAFENITYLKRYERRPFPPEESLWLLKQLEEMGMTTVDYLLARNYMGNFRNEGLAHVWHLLATRRIDCDILRPLGVNTEVWVPEN